jgi:nitroimidazol reductase NimA-like FMN-containing flavoprotein (pyridoxamine 5'-phosphate oxidase superfamily)
MVKTDDIRHQITTLCSSQKLAVLCTYREHQPYASLVAFVATENLKHFYFVTPKSTRKYTNLESNPRVSALVNSSENLESDFHRAMAVTVIGQAAEVAQRQRQSLIDRYVEKHPYLEDFARSPTCALVDIVVSRYILVKNFQHVMELHLRE